MSDWYDDPAEIYAPEPKTAQAKPKKLTPLQRSAKKVADEVAANPALTNKWKAIGKNQSHMVIVGLRSMFPDMEFANVKQPRKYKNKVAYTVMARVPSIVTLETAAVETQEAMVPPELPHVVVPAGAVTAEPVEVHEVDPELEKLLQEEAAIEAQVAETTPAPAAEAPAAETGAFQPAADIPAGFAGDFRPNNASLGLSGG